LYLRIGPIIVNKFSQKSLYNLLNALKSYKNASFSQKLCPRLRRSDMLRLCCGFVAGLTSIPTRIYRSVADVAAPEGGKGYMEGMVK
jgi:hypothetical protein